MKRALMYASVASMIQQFNMNNIRLLQEMNYKVDVACNFEFGSTISDKQVQLLKEQLSEINVEYYHIPVPRKITDFKNLKEAYVKTENLLNCNRYDIVHCHSPIGGMICRIANRNSKNYSYTKMIYTAHGFHFFNGNNPIKNFVFRNAERYGAKYTNTIITINREDFNAAKQFSLRKNGTVEQINGVGVDVKKINSIKKDKDKLCSEIGIPSTSFLMVSVGELNKNKNHGIIIGLLPKLPDDIHYIICGKGDLMNVYHDMAIKLGVADRLHLLGYRSDVFEIIKACDVFVFPSIREGLGLSALEGMAAGLPLITSNGRGMSEYSINNKTGFCCAYDDEIGFYESIMKLWKNPGLRSKFSEYNSNTIWKYDIESINKEMKRIYGALD